MAMIPLAGITYLGKPVYYDDGVVVSPPPTVTPVPNNVSPLPPTTSIGGTVQGGFGSGSGGGFHGVTAVPSAPVPAPPSVAITYPANEVTLEDAMFLYRMDMDYRHRVGTTTQLHFDILTQQGKTYYQMAGLTQAAFKTTINRIINWAGSDHAAETANFDVNAYQGPLKQIYNNLVNFRLGK